MPRFRAYGQFDDPFIEDGDPAFLGLDQQTEPSILQSGMVQVAENVRFDNGVIQSRKGLETYREIKNGKCLVKFSDPINNREDLLVVRNGRVEGVSLELGVEDYNPTRAFKNIYAFGNSYTDQGNYPEELFPLRQKVWVEFLAGKLNLNISASNNGGNNYAIGGARLTDSYEQSINSYTRDVIWENTPYDWEEAGEYILSIQQQISQAPIFDKNDLTCIWGGGNDYLGAGATSQDAMNDMSVVIEQLITRKSKHILVLNMFNLYRMPTVTSVDGADFAQDFNKELKKYIEALETTHPDINFYLVDFYTLVEQVVANPSDYGLADVSGYSDHPTSLFFDPIHMSASMHKHISDECVYTINQKLFSSKDTQYINEGMTSIYATKDDVQGIQAFEKVILFSEGYRPKIWDGVIENGFSELPNELSDGAVNFVCPNAPFGTYFANRLVVPYYEDSPTSVAFSDILEPNDFMDLNTFYCNKGTSDKTVGFASFTENQILVLNSASIHLVNNVHALEGVSASYEITRQYGVAGSRAFAQNGSYTYFVSSEGNFQVLVPSSDPAKGLGVAISKVTLDQEPLSKSITPFINRINLSALEKSIVRYHRNKVYFAVAVDGASYPNAIAVYDSLQSVFVSIDTFSDEAFTILDINSLDDLLFILTPSKVYRYESGNDDDGFPINSKVVTRNYTMQSRDIKKFIRGTISYQSDAGTNIKLSSNLRSPDLHQESKNILSESDENALSRFNIRQRGYSANAQIESTGAMKIKSVSIEAFIGTGKASATYGE